MREGSRALFCRPGERGKDAHRLHCLPAALGMHDEQGVLAGAGAVHPVEPAVHAEPCLAGPGHLGCGDLPPGMLEEPAEPRPRWPRSGSSSKPRSPIPPPCPPRSPGSAPNSPTPGWTGRTCSPRPGPSSPPTSTANPTPCPTCVMNCRPAASSLPTPGAAHDQPTPDAPPGPADTPRRHAAHDAHHRQRPTPRIRRGPGLPLGLAVPLRARPALRGRRCPRDHGLAARRPPALVGPGPDHRRCGGRGAYDVRQDLASRPDRTPVRGHDRARHRRLGRDRSYPRPVPHADAATSGGRGSGPVGALVGAWPPPRQGPRRAQARGLAGDRPGGRARRLAGHVRPGGRVGLAGPAAPGPGPDHHRRDRQDSGPGIGPGHAPGSRSRLPHS